MKRLSVIFLLLGLCSALSAFGARDDGADSIPPVRPPAPPSAEEVYNPYSPLPDQNYTPIQPSQSLNNGQYLDIEQLAILPFSGVTTGDGEALALLFSNNTKLRNTFKVVPLTRNVQQRVRTEQQAASGGPAQQPINLVMVGLVRSFRGSNLMMVNIIDRTRRQLVAGDFRIYRDPSELQTLIPAMVDYMIQGVQKSKLGARRLAVTPFDTPQPTLNSSETEILTMLLSAEIATTGQYAVIPRMEPLLLALDQVDQLNPINYDNVSVIAEVVLTGSVIMLGTKNLFVAQIERISDGGVEHGAEESFESGSDGILQVIPRLSQTLTGVSSVRSISSVIAGSPYGTPGGVTPSGGTYLPTDQQAAAPSAPQSIQQQPNTSSTSLPSTTNYPQQTYPSTSVPYPNAPGNQQYFNPMTPR